MSFLRYPRMRMEAGKQNGLISHRLTSSFQEQGSPLQNLTTKLPICSVTSLVSETTKERWRGGRIPARKKRRPLHSYR